MKSSYNYNPRKSFLYKGCIITYYISEDNIFRENT